MPPPPQSHDQILGQFADVHKLSYKSVAYIYFCMNNILQANEKTSAVKATPMPSNVYTCSSLKYANKTWQLRDVNDGELEWTSKSYLYHKQT